VGYFTDNPEGARRAFNRLCGLHRAAFWRELGFPNLVLARAALARKVAKSKALEQARLFSPFAILDEAEQYVEPAELRPVKWRRK
jgi:hypothetical protein